MRLPIGYLRTALLFGALLHLAPATASDKDPIPQQVSSIPPVGFSQTAYAASTLLRSQFAVVRPGARTAVAVEKHVNLQVFRIEAYEPLVEWHSKAALKACAKQANGVCLFDDDGDGMFDRIAEDIVSQGYRLDQPVSYERVNVTVPETVSRREITLDGIWDRTLSLHYREIAEAPFREVGNDTCTVTLPPTLPAILAVRDYRILIESISLKFISYKVLPLASSSPLQSSPTTTVPMVYCG